MHTVISAFSDRAAAQAAMDRLADAGFSRDDMHLQHRELHLDGAMDREDWDVMEREVAVDRGVLESIGHFFTSIFGQDTPDDRARSYSHAVAHGECVLVLDAPDDAAANRAGALLDDLGGRDRSIVPRSTQRRPVRHLMAGVHEQRGQVDGRERSEIRDAASDRAFAFNDGKRTQAPGERDADVTHPPGLRYADKDKPGST